MTTHEAPLPPRLVDGVGSPQEQAVGEALRAFRAATENVPSESKNFRVALAMRQDASWRRWGRGLSLFGLFASSLAAAVGGFSGFRNRPEPKQEKMVTVPPATTAVAPVVLAPEPPPPVVARLAPQSPHVLKPRETAEADVLLEESRLLMNASAAMNAHDWPTALELLRDYEARFPEGALRVEAGTSKAKVYLMQDQVDEARLVVEQLKPLLGASPRGNELKLFEAELWAARSRCTEALEILDQINSAGWSTQERERAIWVKSNCHLKLGHAAEGVRELEHYLSEFPQGQFSAQATSLLQNLK